MRDILTDFTTVTQQLRIKPDDIKAGLILHYIERVKEAEGRLNRLEMETTEKRN